MYMIPELCYDKIIKFDSMVLKLKQKMTDEQMYS